MGQKLGSNKCDEVVKRLHLENEIFLAGYVLGLGLFLLMWKIKYSNVSHGDLSPCFSSRTYFACLAIL
jgi:hypothetical protein